MGYAEYRMPSLPALADALIAGLSGARDPFVTPTVVCHNARVIQWFKAYYLKKCDKVLMNVRFAPLGRFINDCIKPDERHSVLDRVSLRGWLLQALLQEERYPRGSGMPADYLYDRAGRLDGTLLFELADKLAALYLNYELYYENVDGWEADLFRRVAETAAEHGCYTPKGLFDRSGVLHAPDGPVYVIDNSFLTPLYEDILRRTAENAQVAVYHTEPEAQTPVPGQVFSAPSVLREVEAIHSEICKRLQDDPSLRFNDFLVYAPDINVYTNAIRRVFQQDDRKFLSVPFRIVGEFREKQDMKASLQTLLDIAAKRFFTRTDFFRFVKNPLVKWVHGIEDADIADWMEAINKSNTHRSGKDEANYYPDDWDYLKKRLLLTLVVADSADYEFQTELSGKVYLPFTTISLEPESINRMIDMIDLLQRWCAAFPDELNNVIVSPEKREELCALLDAMYSSPGPDGEEKNYLYREVLAELERVRELELRLPAGTLLRLLTDAPDAYCVDRGDIFTNGVNFMSLRCDDAVAADYIFVMGMSSKAFPRVEVKSELDLSENRALSQETDALSIRNVFANAGHITFSFVSCDLQKDEPFYLTSLVQRPEQPTVVPLDETRAPEELFTRREFRSRDYFNRIGAQADEPGVADEPAPSPREKTVTLRDMKKFFENTFVYKFNKLLGKSEDEEENYDEFEPLELEPLHEHTVAKEIICAAAEADADADETEQYQRIKQHMENLQLLPPDAIGDKAFQATWEDTRAVRKCTQENAYRKHTLPALQMQTVCGGETLDWQLLCNLTVFRKAEGSERWYIEPIIPDDKARKKLPVFLYSLMDVAAEPEEREYTVHLAAWATESEFEISPSTARDILNEIYCRMTDYAHIRYMDIEYAAAKVEDDLPDTLSEFLYGISYHNGWKNFRDKTMVDAEKALAFDADDLIDDYYSFRKLLLFLPQLEAEEGEENDGI